MFLRTSIQLLFSFERPAAYALVAFFMFGAFAASAQTSPQVIRFVAPGFDLSESASKDSAGNVYVAGSVPQSNAQTAFAVLKYNPQGDLVWVAHYDALAGAFNGSAIAVAVDAVGDVYAIGRVQPELVSYAHDFLIVKFNSSGVEQWANRISNGTGRRIVVGSDGSVYATGSSQGNWLTIKYSPTGKRLWAQGSSIPGQPMDMEIDSEDTIIVTGFSRPTLNSPIVDFTTLKYDASGNELFRTTFSDTAESDDIPFDLDIDAQGNTWVTGLTQPGPYDPQVPVTLKYGPAGDLQASIRDAAAGGFSVDADAANNVYVAGFSAAGKFSSSGVPIWEQALSFPARKILVDSSGSSFVAGSQYYSGDYLTVKYDPQGNQIFQHTFNGPGNGNDQVSDIILDNSENLFVIGSSRIDSYVFEDILLLKFARNAIPNPQPLAAPSDLMAISSERRSAYL
ncbi:MAG TPA: hypothetical protein VJL58_01410, partial [Pyrinomonadaceae bacterium]|nr:hypothetical protein [Pyrinomonadaceae bacterium]